VYVFGLFPSVDIWNDGGGPGTGKRAALYQSVGSGGRRPELDMKLVRKAGKRCSACNGISRRGWNWGGVVGGRAQTGEHGPARNGVRRDWR